MDKELEERLERLLETYTLKGILDYNDLEEYYVLAFLYEEGLIVFPPEPV